MCPVPDIVFEPATQPRNFLGLIGNVLVAQAPRERNNGGMFIRRIGWGLWLGFLILLEAGPVFAGLPSITLAWDPSPAANIGGYRLYLGLSSGTYATTLDVGVSTNATLSNLTPGTTYYFVVTAYDTNHLESPFSGEISYTVPVGSNLARLKISLSTRGQVQVNGTGPIGYTYALQGSHDLRNWTPLTTVIMDATGSFLFLDTPAPGKANFYRLHQLTP